jgi:hypothetical protein
VTAYVDGHNRATNGDKTEPMSNDDFDRMLAMHGISQD